MRRRTSLTRPNGTSTTYGYDPVSRLSNLTHHMASSANDLSITNTYNLASQIVSEDRSNDSYSFTGNANSNTGYTSDGLNRVTLGGSTVYSYDANGNIASDGFFTFTYDAENKLVSALPSNAGVRTLSYDPLNRLDLYNPGTAKRFIYDGDEVAAELDSSGNIVARHVRGDGPDELITWYTSANPSDRGWYHLDQRNSVIAVTNQPGTITVVNRYDEYGTPQGGNYGPFQYTGQMWLGEIGIYNYKNRMYWPSTLPGGRFMQTDPAKYRPGMNLYEAMGSNPISNTDPTGMEQEREPIIGPETVTSREVFNPGSWGHSWDWMGQMGTPIMGRYDEILIDYRLPWAEAALARMSASTGVTQQCLLTCPYAIVFALGTGGPTSANPMFQLAGMTQYGPAFGDYRSNSSRGIMSFRSGGYDQAISDINLLAIKNGLVPPGPLTRGTAPPVGWFEGTTPSGGWRLFNPGGLKLRITNGEPHIDIRPGVIVGPLFTDRSWNGEVVHYGR